MVRFAPLPEGFPKLAAMARRVSGHIPPPPDLRALGERVYDECASLTMDDLDKVRASTWRKIPYAMWLDAARDINANAAVIDKYYHDLDGLELPGSGRTKRWLSPLLHAYVEKFDVDGRDFKLLANHLRRAAQRCDAIGFPVLSLARLQRDWQFFDVEDVGRSVARGVLDHAGSPSDIDDWFNTVGLWAGFKGTKLGRHVFRSALALPEETYRDTKNIVALAAWAKAYKALTRQEETDFAEALLRPWLAGDPDEETRRLVGDHCVARLGDPRRSDDARGGSGSWSRVDSACRDLLLRWLTGRTLEAFFDVLRLTADQIWEHRQQFWTGYYRQGYITEAWAVLGPDAQALIRQRFRGADLHFGKLVGQVDSAQSVLLMRMGELVFSEWSHNGKLRAAEMGSRQAPRMYDKAYDAESLRFRSLRFIAANGTEHAGLPHLRSETRWWQDTAARFIRSQLGV